MSIYETHIMQDPQLPFIFHKNTGLSYKNHIFNQANWHENTEIIYITDGEGIVAYDTEHLRVSKGDFVVINQNVMHSFSADTPRLSYHCLIVDRAFCLANHFDTNAISFESFFRDESLGVLMERLAAEYTKPYRERYRVQMIRALVLQIMAVLCCSHALPEEPQRTDHHVLSCIKQAIGYIRSRSDHDISLDSVSKFVGLSKYYFAREFRRVTGHTFVSYVNLIRCEKAKKLLAENQLRIGDVGRACGFDNQSYFTRTFRTYTGRLPSEYRERLLEQKKREEFSP